MKQKILHLLRSGLNREEAVHYLKDSGYNEQDIRAAMGSIYKEMNAAEKANRRKDKASGFLFLIIGILLIARGALPIGNGSLFLGFGIVTTVFAFFLLLKPLF